MCSDFLAARALQELDNNKERPARTMVHACHEGATDAAVRWPPIIQRESGNFRALFPDHWLETCGTDASGAGTLPSSCCRQGQPLTVSHRAGRRTFQLLLIKPSHYDDDGYVIRWWRAMIPSNSLAALLRHRRRLRRAARARPGRRHRHRRRIDETNTRVDMPALLAKLRGTAISAWWHWSACSPTSIPARSTSPGRSATRACLSPWAASTCPAACRCSTARRSSSTPAASWASRCSPAKPKAGLTRVLQDAARGRARAALQFHERPARHRRHAGAVPAEALCRAHARPHHQLRRRPRLPLSMLVLHDHQRAGPQIALSARPTTWSGWCG